MYLLQPTTIKRAETRLLVAFPALEQNRNVSALMSSPLAKLRVDHPQGFTGGRYDMIKHGFARRGYLHPVYTCWQDMHKRCRNPKNWAYHYYHGKGIKICPEWMTFIGFASDMADSWKPGLTLERRKNGKGYNAANCYWATRQQQSRNRDYCRYLTLNGKRMLAIEWAEKLGWQRNMILARIDKLGWSVRRALTTPPRPMKRRKS